MTRSTPGASRAKVKHTTGHRSRPELRGAVARRLAALALLVPVSALAAEQAPGLPLTLEADLPLPGDSSRFHYESYGAGRNLPGWNGVRAAGGQAVRLGRNRRDRNRDRRPVQSAHRDDSSGWRGWQHAIRSRFPTHLRERAVAPATGRNRSGDRPGHRPDRLAGREGQSRTADRARAAAGLDRVRGQRQTAGVRPGIATSQELVRGRLGARRAGLRRRAGPGLPRLGVRNGLAVPTRRWA